MPRSSARTRDRILEAAYRLFYREGFARAGVDAVAEEAGVTKRTLYNHFPSKDALIGAVTERQAELVEAEFLAWTASASEGPGAMMRRLFGLMRDWAAAPGWAGPGFTRTAMELAWAPGHPARRTAARHKRMIESLLAGILADAGAGDPPTDARRLILLIEGALALRLIHGDDAYLDAAEAAALALIVPSSGGNSPNRPDQERVRPQ